MSIEIVREYFRKLGIEDRIMEFETSSATVELAAEAVGTEPERICKTISFGKPEGGCILIQAAGDVRIDNRRFKDCFRFKARMLKPDEVVEYTGHEIGGVCAFGISREDVDVYCDESLRRFETVFPACGSSNSAAEFTPDELEEVSRAKGWVDVGKPKES